MTPSGARLLWAVGCVLCGLAAWQHGLVRAGSALLPRSRNQARQHHHILSWPAERPSPPPLFTLCDARMPLLADRIAAHCIHVYMSCCLSEIQCIARARGRAAPQLSGDVWRLSIRIRIRIRIRVRTTVGTRTKRSSEDRERNMSTLHRQRSNTAPMCNISGWLVNHSHVNDK